MDTSPEEARPRHMRTRILLAGVILVPAIAYLILNFWANSGGVPEELQRPPAALAEKYHVGSAATKRIATPPAAVRRGESEPWYLQYVDYLNELAARDSIQARNADI